MTRLHSPLYRKDRKSRFVEPTTETQSSPTYEKRRRLQNRGFRKLRQGMGAARLAAGEVPHFPPLEVVTASQVGAGLEGILPL
jgi:hypothetical protein